MMTIILPSDLENRLKGEAARRGLSAEEVAKKLLADNLPPTPQVHSIADLFAQWAAADPAQTPDELARRAADWEDLKRNLNQNRLDSEGPSTRKLFP